VDVLFLQVIAGLTVGALYAAVALGFTLIWNALRIVNFAQGDLVMLGGFVGWTLFVVLNWPFPVAFVGAVLVMALFGVVMQQLIIRPIVRAEWYTAMLVTLGASIVFQNAARFIWGAAPVSFPSIFGGTPLELGPVFIIPQNLWILAIVCGLMLLQHAFFARTSLGKAMSAVAQDREMASMLGINVNVMLALTFALAAGLAAAAGVLIAPLVYLQYPMGIGITLKAFAATIIGGFGNVAGAIVGGLLLGVVESLAAGFISSDYKDAIAFVVVIGMLLIRPEGLLRADE
jgi:branched-chain amino acid transport system permease protein